MKYLWFLAVFLTGVSLAETADTTGLETLRRAAEQGSVEAQYELGVLYEFGFRLPDHKANAYAWYSRAAERGDATAAKRRDALREQLSAADIERATTLAPLATAPAPTPADASVPSETAKAPAEPAPAPAPTPAPQATPSP